MSKGYCAEISIPGTCFWTRQVGARPGEEDLPHLSEESPKASREGEFPKAKGTLEVICFLGLPLAFSHRILPGLSGWPRLSLGNEPSPTPESRAAAPRNI